jgi:hypothetical protein
MYRARPLVVNSKTLLESHPALAHVLQPRRETKIR